MSDPVERGMKLAAERPEVMPDQADERIRPVYEDIQRTLRVPFVNLIFRHRKPSVSVSRRRSFFSCEARKHL